MLSFSLSCSAVAQWTCLPPSLNLSACWFVCLPIAYLVPPCYPACLFASRSASLDVKLFVSILVCVSMSVCPPIYLSVCLSVCFCAGLTVSLWVSLPVCHSSCLSVCLPACLSVYMSVYLCAGLLVSLWVNLPVCQPIHLYACLSVCVCPCAGLSTCRLVYLFVRLFMFKLPSLPFLLDLKVTEPACIIPLLCNCEAAVLVGDPQQLPPTVLSKTVSAQLLKYKALAHEGQCIWHASHEERSCWISPTVE